MSGEEIYRKLIEAYRDQYYPGYEIIKVEEDEQKHEKTAI